MIRVKQMVRRHRKTKKWRRQNTKKQLPIKKKMLFDSSFHSFVDPNTLPQSVSNATSIDVWWRQNKWLECIENQESDGDRTIKNTYLSWKTALRLESPDLHWSKHTTAILIEFCIDWCMITVKQVVRRHWKSRKWRWHNINDHLPIKSKTRLTSRVALAL